MKRWFLFALCVVFLLGAAGCGADKSPNTSITEGQSTAGETDRAYSNLY